MTRRLITCAVLATAIALAGPISRATAQYVARNQPAKAALAAPRLHTEGGLKVELEKEWPETVAAQLQAAGYTVTRASSATVSAVWRDAASGAVGGASR